MNFPSNSLTFALPALVLVLGLIWLTGRLARGFGLNRLNARVPSGGRLRIVERLPVDANRQLLLTSCDGQEVLVLTGSAQDLNLGWLSDLRPPA